MKIHKIISPLMLALALYGCSDTNEDLAAEAINGQTQYTLCLEVKEGGSFAASRAPKPTEAASYNEGKLHDAVLVIYGTSMQGKTPALTGVMPLYAFDVTLTPSGTTGLYRTSDFEMKLDAGTYYYVVIANPDASVNASTFKSRDLAYLHDYEYTPQLYKSASSTKAYDRFVMTSDTEGTFTVTDEDLEGTAPINISRTGAHVVERLATRIDLSFGAPSAAVKYYDNGNNALSINSGVPTGTVSKIVLPVYDYAAYTESTQLLATGDYYTITDIDLNNVVDNKEYAFQRTSDGLFYDEQWKNTVGYANKSTGNPQDINRVSLTTPTLASLIVADNNLYSDGSTPYYTIGYFRENTNKKSTIAEGKTSVVIKGTYHNTGNLIGATNDFEKNIEFIIRHCQPTDGGFDESKALAYAMVRNTIYRLRIDKLFSDGDRVYVRWYYDSTNDGEYDPVTTGTPFFSAVQEGNGSSPID